MKFRPLFTIARWALWIAGIATTARQAWHLFNRTPRTRSEEKQRRKQLVKEAMKSRNPRAA